MFLILIKNYNVKINIIVIVVCKFVYFLITKKKVIKQDI